MKDAAEMAAVAEAAFYCNLVDFIMRFSEQFFCFLNSDFAQIVIGTHPEHPVKVAKQSPFRHPRQLCKFSDIYFFPKVAVQIFNR